MLRTHCADEVHFMRTSLAIFLFCSAAVLSFFYWRGVPEPLPLDLTANRKLGQANSDLQIENDKLRAKVSAAAQPTTEREKSTVAPKPFLPVTALLEQPATARMGFAAMRASHKHRYNALFSALGLTEAERDAVATAMVEHTSARGDLAMLNMGHSSGTSADVKQIEDDFASKLEAEIGPERASKILYAVNKGTDWDSARHLQENLSYDGGQMTADQLNSLLSVWNIPKARVPTTPQAIETFTAKKSEANSRIIAQAREFLTPVQMEALTNALAANLSSRLYMVYQAQAEIEANRTASKRR